MLPPVIRPGHRFTRQLFSIAFGWRMLFNVYAINANDEVQCLPESLYNALLVWAEEIKFYKRISFGRLHHVPFRRLPNTGSWVERHRKTAAAYAVVYGWRMEMWENKNWRRGKTLCPNIKFHLFRHLPECLAIRHPVTHHMGYDGKFLFCYLNVERGKPTMKFTNKIPKNEWCTIMHEQGAHTRTRAHYSQKSETMTTTKTIGLVVDVTLQR